MGVGKEKFTWQALFNLLTFCQSISDFFPLFKEPGNDGFLQQFQGINSDGFQSLIPLCFICY